MRREVFVRGIGAWTPLGKSWPSTFNELRRGRGAVRPIEQFDARGFPCAAAAAIPECRIDGEDPRQVLAIEAAREAWRAACVPEAPGPIGVFIGAEAGHPSFSAVLQLAEEANGTPARPGTFGTSRSALAEQISPALLSPAAVASRLAHELGASGPVETISLACASGAAAIAMAVRAIRLGECNAAVAGGVGADVDPFMLAGFGLLSALSSSGISRPFDVRRDGFVLGEGAAMAVLSCERGPASVEVGGIGLTVDGYRLTAPEPTGAAAARAMQLAMAEAMVDSVDYVQAHGTSTPLNDAVEAAVIRRVLGQHVASAHVSSVKGALGHSIAAAGAMGFLCAVEAVASGTILPTLGLEEPDPVCELPHVTEAAIENRVDAALVNSLAFGGANCCIVVRRCA